MNPVPATTTHAERAYADAHAAHYTVKDLPCALELYVALITAHPDAPQAGYSRSQIQNIVNSVVPKEQLLEAQVALVQAHFGATSPVDTTA